MLQIKSFVFNPLQENTYVLFDETGECVIIDPGCYTEAERQELTSFITSRGLTVRLLLNTHCHVDHVLGNRFVKERYNVLLHIHPLDEATLKAVEIYAPHYGFYQYQGTTADQFLQEETDILFGRTALRVLFVPGHAPGHVAFYAAREKIAVSGDVLFYNSVGRTDLPGGNFETLLHSIHRQLFTLPDDVTVYPGHGPETSIGFEKRTNPFCALP